MLEGQNPAGSAHCCTPAPGTPQNQPSHVDWWRGSTKEIPQASVLYYTEDAGESPLKSATHCVLSMCQGLFSKLHTIPLNPQSNAESAEMFSLQPLHLFA